MGEKKRRLALAAQASIPDTPQAYVSAAREILEQGLLLHRAGDLVAAVNAYRKVEQYTPQPSELTEALHYHGLALFQLGEQALGIVLMRQSLAMHEAAENAQFHFNLGKALIGSEPAQALTYLRRAVQLAPAEFDFILALAEVLYQQQCRAEAIDALQRVLALAPERVATLNILAELHYQENRLEQAQQYFDQALALSPRLAKTRQIGYALPQPDAIEAKTWLRLADLGHLGASIWGDQAALDAYTSAAALDLHIIDQFLPDLPGYRTQALALPFHELRYVGQNYPGRQTDGTPCQGIMTRIATALGRRIKFISPDNGSYRLSFADSLARTDIHVDNESGDQFNIYAAVLYLNAPEQCQGGTSFWRHRDSGWLRRPPDSAVRAAGYANFTTFQQRWLPHNADMQDFNQLAQRRSAWEAVLEVPMRSNRLILYRGDYFHSISEVFGGTQEDGRLVQLFFFEVLD